MRVVPKLTTDPAGDGDFEVSAGTLTFGNCVLKRSNTTMWDVTGGTLHVTSDCDCGELFYDYTACDIDLSGGTLKVDNAFKTTGNVTISATGTLDVDNSFTGTGTLAFSGGTISVAAGKAAAFTPDD